MNIYFVSRLQRNRKRRWLDDRLTVLLVWASEWGGQCLLYVLCLIVMEVGGSVLLWPCVRGYIFSQLTQETFHVQSLKMVLNTTIKSLRDANHLNLITMMASFSCTSVLLNTILILRFIYKQFTGVLHPSRLYYFSICFSDLLFSSICVTYSLTTDNKTRYVVLLGKSIDSYESCTLRSGKVAFRIMYHTLVD